MAKKSTSTAAPRLRFPEFRKASDWNRTASDWTTTELRELSKFVTERVGDTKCTPYTITSGTGLVSQQEKLGRTIAGNSLKNYIVLQKNDFAYNKSATKAFPQEFIARYVGDERAAVPNSIFTCFRTNDGVIDSTYLDNLFSTNLHGNWLRNRIAVGARAHGSLNVSDEDLMDLPVPLPGGSSSLAEQQKIADCLTSLDDLIITQGRKVEALKTHKRGLMQQLFPREGETRPRLRFPEFHDAPEWETREVGEVFRVTRGEVLAMPLVKGERSAEAPYPVYSSQTKNRGLAGYFSDFLYEDAITWTTDGANAGDVRYREGKFYCTNVCGVLLSNEGYANTCVSAMLNTVTRSHVSYVGNPKLMNGVMAKITFPFPRLEEQLRIADFLSSLDTQIAAESNQLDALKTHKQGLMQQLFPAPETTGA